MLADTIVSFGMNFNISLKKNFPSLKVGVTYATNCSGLLKRLTINDYQNTTYKRLTESSPTTQSDKPKFFKGLYNL